MEGWARNLGLGAALAFAIVPAQGFAQSRDSFHDLLAAYRCEVVHRLEKVYATGNPAIDRDRFIAVTVPGHPHGYVQCIFHDHQTGVYCEASSGFYYAKKGQPRTFHQSSNAITALAKLGFDGRQQRKFQNRYECGRSAQFQRHRRFHVTCVARRLRRAPA
ncbi:MAG TPA: hypothetical protein VFC45_05375 [Pseudolabrys sp.]|nr:hypothetical protein [Pseudolabrys sp.]